MYKDYQFYLAQFYRIADLIALNVAYFLFALLCIEKSEAFYSNTFIIFIFINILWLFISGYNRLYIPGVAKSKNRYVFSIGMAIFFTFSFNLFIASIISIIPGKEPIVFLLKIHLLFTVLLGLFRWLTSKGYKFHLSRKNKKLAVVMVGKGLNQRELTKYFKQSLNTEFQKVITIKQTENLIENLSELQKTETITQLFIPLSKYDQETINLIGKYCDNN